MLLISFVPIHSETEIGYAWMIVYRENKGIEYLTRII
jgi:hypothetical protein